MRIMVLAWRDIWHAEAGGSERYLHEILRRLADSGHEITYVTARSPGRPHRDRVDGIDYLRGGGRLTVYPRGLLALIRHRSRVDVVIDVINGIPFASPLVRRRGVLALVHHVHREQWRLIYPDWRGRLGWLIESRLVPVLYQRHPFVTVSSATREELHGLGVHGDHVTIVRNAGNCDVPLGQGRRSPTPRLVCLGRLVPHKQVEHAIQAAAMLQTEFPELTLDVIGEGYSRSDLELRSTELGITDRVVFHGWLPQEERDTLLAQAWVLVFPSVKEGWGLVVTEAGTFGVPTVAYRKAGGVAESIEHGLTGLLVDSEDELVDAVRRVLRDSDLRTTLGAAARKKALSRTWESASAEMAALIGQLIQRSP